MGKERVRAKIILAIFGAILLASVLSLNSNAQTKDRDLSYFCTAEVSGGLSYDKRKKKWEGVGFRTTHKFVLRLKFLEEHQLKHETDVAYEVMITDAGKNVPAECKSDMNSKEVLVSGLGHVVFCNAEGEGYRINLDNNRYLKTFPFGYYTVGSGKIVGEREAMTIVPDTDEDSDTPYLEGGVCTKID